MTLVEFSAFGNGMLIGVVVSEILFTIAIAIIVATRRR